MDGNDLVKAIRVLNPNKVIPIHYKGWTHFKESEIMLKNVIGHDVKANARTTFLEPGVATEIG